MNPGLTICISTHDNDDGDWFREYQPFYHKDFSTDIGCYGLKTSGDCTRRASQKGA
jgi:hypothetical protein